MSELANMKRLIEVMARLRAPDGCPWDREQTHDSLKKYAIEEAYELAEAVDEKSDIKMREELGDLLLQVVFHAQVAAERGAFTFEDVAAHIVEKLERRHPHVFGEVKVKDSEEVIANWEAIKLMEKAGQPEKKKGRFSGIPRHLPALLTSFRICEKAPATCPGEAQLVASATAAHPLTPETIGDRILALAQLAWRWGLDPEEELRRRNRRLIEENEERRATRNEQ